VPALTVDGLRRFAVARSFFAPGSLPGALDRFGFVQADPIRAPARAQDLTLRHRVTGYRAGDLERTYGSLDVEEAFFVNYGFVTRAVADLMLPRGGIERWPTRKRRRAQEILDLVAAAKEVHPREVDRQLAHGRVTNYWGGSSSASTHMLDQLHYLGLVRVTRREKGIRLYGPGRSSVGDGRPPHRDVVVARVDQLVDVIVAKYAPLPSASLSFLVRRILQLGVPHLKTSLAATLARTKSRLAHARIDDTDWYWLPDERTDQDVPERVRLLAPFDPLVWDRRRFERLWGWTYRFEAYTPVAKRKLGYYAMPLLWHDRVIGWANASVSGGTLDVSCGYCAGAAPRSRAFRQALDTEVAAFRSFLAHGERGDLAEQ
jgi:uncharacterized protein YcaQ